LYIICGSTPSWRSSIYPPFRAIQSDCQRSFISRTTTFKAISCLTPPIQLAYFSRSLGCGCSQRNLGVRVLIFMIKGVKR